MYVPFDGVPPPMPSGDTAFADLYRGEFEPMRRLARVLVDTDDQATDVVQEAFSRLYPRFDRLTDHRAYLRAAVLNGARRVVRRTVMFRTRVRTEPNAPASQHDHVVDAIRALPTAQCQVIVLRYYLQLTDDEIAETLGMRLGTVKSTLHRARAQLRKDLQP